MAESPDAESISKSYSGGCHCGAVRYTVRADLGMVIACNCSICSKRAALLSFAPASAFTLERGESSLTDYQFNKKVIHHLFCATCGIASFGSGTGPDGSEMVAINVRCLDDVDPDALTVTKIDGRSF